MLERIGNTTWHGKFMTASANCTWYAFPGWQSELRRHARVRGSAGGAHLSNESDWPGL